ncbi:MAG TPA: DUF2163 domain-containing protein [Blastocatellia bacterium]|nr:DUF2163 domain-containing protein [Blastocatellia bacterium]
MSVDVTQVGQLLLRVEPGFCDVTQVGQLILRRPSTRTTNVTTAMKTHLASSPMTICTLWRIEERRREIPVTWPTKTNLSVRGWALKKNAGTDGTFDAGAFSHSSHKITGDGRFRFRSDRLGTVAAGLSSTNGGVSEASIQFCIKVDLSGTITVLESGTVRATASGYRRKDDLWIKKQSGVITYWHNRTLLYTSALTPAATLYPDCSIATTGASISQSALALVPTVITLSNHTRNLTWQGEVYRPAPMNPSAMALSEGLKVNNAEVSCVLSSDNFTKADLFRGRWNHARVELYAVNYNDLTMGYARKAVGYFGEIRPGNGTFNTEFRGLSQLLDVEVGDVYSSVCGARKVGDQICGQPLADYMHEATITAVTDDQHFTVDLSPAKDSGYFDHGEIYFLSGDNKYNYGEIKHNAGNAIALKPLPTMEVSVGDTVMLVKGCARNREACKTFVNIENPSGTNIENHAAFPDIPGLRKTYHFPS